MENELPGFVQSLFRLPGFTRDAMAGRDGGGFRNSNGNCCMRSFGEVTHMYTEGDIQRWKDSLRLGDMFHITGILAPPSRKRFKIVTSNVHQALGINLWRGNVWLVRDGKRRSIRKVTN